MQSAALIAAKVAQRTLTPAQASQQLQPLAGEVTALAKKNSTLPISHALTQLADAVTALEKLAPSDVSGVQAGSGRLLSATKAVLADCVAVRH